MRLLIARPPSKSYGWNWSLGAHGVDEAGQRVVKTGRRKLDPERTRQDILAAAREEFAERGLNGARMDAIASCTKTPSSI